MSKGFFKFYRTTGADLKLISPRMDIQFKLFVWILGVGGGEGRGCVWRDGFWVSVIGKKHCSRITKKIKKSTKIDTVLKYGELL
jgi:hypothetical protein